MQRRPEAIETSRIQSRFRDCRFPAKNFETPYKKIGKTKIAKLPVVISKSYLCAFTKICTYQGHEISWRNHQKKLVRRTRFWNKSLWSKNFAGFLFVLKCIGIRTSNSKSGQETSTNDRCFPQLCVLPVYFVLPLSLPSFPPGILVDIDRLIIFELTVLLFSDWNKCL